MELILKNGRNQIINYKLSEDSFGRINNLKISKIGSRVKTLKMLPDQIVYIKSLVPHYTTIDLEFNECTKNALSIFLKEYSQMGVKNVKLGKVSPKHDYEIRSECKIVIMTSQEADLYCFNKAKVGYSHSNLHRSNAEYKTLTGLKYLEFDGLFEVNDSLEENKKLIKTCLKYHFDYSKVALLILHKYSEERTKYLSQLYNYENYGSQLNEDFYNYADCEEIVISQATGRDM
mmetsp:Transcript_12437/g.11021  ORF Transcript_12437/g.11021 Transcript_12437/m.11021 type:complete len:232 (+) Transcript_12437:567-1262(+)